MVETLVENGGGEDWGATIASRIKEVKRYFKTDYKTHTSREEHCADHCTTYALSDPKNKVLTNICKHKHDVECERCGSLEYLFKEIKEKIDNLSLDEELFQTLRVEYPQIKKTFLRSDNAACYHNGPLLLCLAEIGKRTGIKVIRYDFSEPQAGKDICDRKTAPMKAHIGRFVNEKNDVVTAEDMKRAIESYGGLMKVENEAEIRPTPCQYQERYTRKMKMGI